VLHAEHLASLVPREWYDGVGGRVHLAGVDVQVAGRRVGAEKAELDVVRARHALAQLLHVGAFRPQVVLESPATGQQALGPVFLGLVYEGEHRPRVGPQSDPMIDEVLAFQQVRGIAGSVLAQRRGVGNSYPG